jgi:hypothetical protein
MAESGAAQSAAVPLSQHEGNRTREQRAETQYLDALAELFVHADNTGQTHVLADVLAWTIARLAFPCGPSAIGDALRRIGGYLQTLEAQRRATEEAAKAREEGLLLS